MSASYRKFWIALVRPSEPEVPAGEDWCAGIQLDAGRPEAADMAVLRVQYFQAGRHNVTTEATIVKRTKLMMDITIAH